ncbi:hypothetical protein GJ496_006206 [Pomphorhynchus laevis]|nr:hypothetical protein GJ496_006206 [Pomphorhynchus laevis]
MVGINKSSVQEDLRKLLPMSNETKMKVKTLEDELRIAKQNESDQFNSLVQTIDKLTAKDAFDIESDCRKLLESGNRDIDFIREQNKIKQIHCDGLQLKAEKMLQQSDLIYRAFSFTMLSDSPDKDDTESVEMLTNNTIDTVELNEQLNDIWLELNEKNRAAMSNLKELEKTLDSLKQDLGDLIC